MTSCFAFASDTRLNLVLTSAYRNCFNENASTEGTVLITLQSPKPVGGVSEAGHRRFTVWSNSIGEISPNGKPNLTFVYRTLSRKTGIGSANAHAFESGTGHESYQQNSRSHCLQQGHLQKVRLGREAMAPSGGISGRH